MTNILLSFYALLLYSGAYFGHKAGSKISGIMGVLTGSAVMGGLYLTQNNPKAGYILILVVSIMLVVVFSIRLTKTKKFMPSGLLIIASLVALGLSIVQLQNI